MISMQYGSESLGAEQSILVCISPVSGQTCSAGFVIYNTVSLLEKDDELSWTYLTFLCMLRGN